MMELDILSGSPAVGVPSHEGFLQNVSIREKADIFSPKKVVDGILAARTTKH